MRFDPIQIEPALDICPRPAKPQRAAFDGCVFSADVEWYGGEVEGALPCIGMKTRRVSIAQPNERELAHGAVVPADGEARGPGLQLRCHQSLQ